MIGENIKKFRKQANITQLELSKMVGYNDRSTITKIEKGAIDLPESKIIAIASALNVSPYMLVDWDTTNDSDFDFYNPIIENFNAREDKLLENLCNIVISAFEIEGIKITAKQRELILKSLQKLYIDINKSK